MNYIEKIRSKIGSEKFIHPAARIIIENDRGEFLFIEKVNDNQWGIPAGALEENETIIECIIREVLEETGLKISTPQIIGISSNPALESVTYPNGDKIQYFTIEFYADRWIGEIRIQDFEEIKRARFMGKEMIEELPRNEKSTFESLDYFKQTGQVNIR